MNVVIVNQSLNNESFDRFNEQFLNSQLSYFASELLNYGFRESSEINLAVQRAMSICKTAGIDINKNFKAVYTHIDGEIISDWRLSALASKLVFLNAGTENPFVAKLQLELIGNF